MGLLDKLFSKPIDEPIFLKEYDKESNIQLNQLNELLDKVGDDQKAIIEEEIKKIQAGLNGERNVAYELRTSFLPIICLHDIRLVYKDYSAQYDFIVISKECIFVFETKTLIGDIIIDSYGNFIRVFKDYKGNVYKKEGINSPISQNEKHVDILTRFLSENKMNKNIPITSVIVIANSKSIIDFKFTKKEIRNMIIKHDQIKSKINEICSSVKINHPLSNKAMLEIAEFLLANDKHIEYDYIKRFHLKLEEVKEPITDAPKEIETLGDTENKEKVLDDSLYEELRTYRLEKSKEKNIQLWFVFTNEQLANLVLNRPKNKEEFININGFGEAKYLEYGQDIINIIWKDSEPVLKDEGVSSNDSQNLYNKLKTYRFNQSKAENIKPYFIYNNDELELLCSIKPKNKEELIAIKGFGEKKFEKYGSSILDIINKYE